MRCPFRMKGFDQPDTCDPECAWLLESDVGETTSCAVTALAYAITCLSPQSDGWYIPNCDHGENLSDYIDEINDAIFKDEPDGREKLESDAMALFRDFRCNSNLKDSNGFWYGKLQELLDRQAAITRNEMMRDGWFVTYKEQLAMAAQEAGCDECGEYKMQAIALAKENAELQSRLDEYEDAEFVVPLEDAMKFTTDPPKYVKAQIQKLQIENGELHKKLEEGYRSYEELRISLDLMKCQLQGKLREIAEIASDPLTPADEMQLL